MRVIILSAGLGERLRPLTSVRAKPAIEFLNLPMLAFPFYWLNTLGLSEVVINTHHLPETVRHAAMHVIPPELPLHFTHETSILGSGGGVWNARFHLKGESSFALANGDGVILADDLSMLRKMREWHEHEDALATFLVCPLEGVGTRIPGVWVSRDGRVAAFGKQSPGGDSQCFHYASYLFLSERIWDHLPEGSSNIIYDVIEPAMKAGEKVLAYCVNQMRWFETGNASDYLAATRYCLERLAKPDPQGDCLRAILNSFSQDNELRASQDGSLGWIHASAKIAPSAKCQGFYVIGEDAAIEDHVDARDFVALPGSRMLAGTHIVNQILI